VKYWQSILDKLSESGWPETAFTILLVALLVGCLVFAFARKFRVALLLLAALLIAGVAWSDMTLFLLAGTFGELLCGYPSEKDYSEATELRDEISKKDPPAQRSSVRPGDVPIFVTAGSRQILTNPTELVIYYITDRAQQDRIVEDARLFRAEHNSLPIEIQFIESENWIVTGNMGDRGPETQLRRVRISGQGVQEQAGKRVITYPIP